MKKIMLLVVVAIVLASCGHEDAKKTVVMDANGIHVMTVGEKKGLQIMGQLPSDNEEVLTQIMGE